MERSFLYVEWKQHHLREKQIWLFYFYFYFQLEVAVGGQNWGKESFWMATKINNIASNVSWKTLENLNASMGLSPFIINHIICKSSIFLKKQTWELPN